MFERFHRVKHSRARTHEGTGIGLALVQELARLHGGDVTVASEEGRGTTFTVTIRTGTVAPAARTDRRGPPAVVDERRRASRTSRKRFAGCPRRTRRRPEAAGHRRYPRSALSIRRDGRSRAGRRRQRGHARLSPPHPRTALSRRSRRRRPRRARSHSPARSRSRARRRDDADPRWIWPVDGDSRRRTEPLASRSFCSRHVRAKRRASRVCRRAPTSISSSRSARANCSRASPHSSSWRGCGARPSGCSAIAASSIRRS